MNVVDKSFLVWFSYRVAACNGTFLMASVYAVPLYQVSAKVVYGFVFVMSCAVVNLVVFTYLVCHGLGCVVLDSVCSTYLFSCAIVSVVL